MSVTASPPRLLLSNLEKSVLGLMYTEHQPIDRMAVALDREKSQVQEIVMDLIEGGFARKFEKTDKPYFGTTMLGKEAAI